MATKQPLNKRQEAAVHVSATTNCLVLSGAGTGKTSVLAHRIAHLIRDHGYQPNEILTLTFTNKAAREMKQRIKGLLSAYYNPKWAGTFHSIGRKFIDSHSHQCGWQKPIQIIDSSEQAALIKNIFKELKEDFEKEDVKNCQSFINSNKEKGIRSEDISISKDKPLQNRLLKYYQIYEKKVREGNLLDFSELILSPVELFSQRDIQMLYSGHFKAILIDEFQDTSQLQFEWVTKIANNKVPIFAVGDDDQSIYGWRGADSGILFRFQKELKGVELIKLEQNYRSTSVILDCANHLITNNKSRLEKKLWTSQSGGNLLTLIVAPNEHLEAKEVLSQIKKWSDKGIELGNIAILYRLNRFSRLLEQKFIQNDMSYIIYGGLSFFERKEVKDVLSYLRFIRNHKDTVSFERIINTPSRKVGNQTLLKIRNYMEENSIDAYTAIKNMVKAKLFTNQLTNNLKNFIEIISRGKVLLEEEELPKAIKKIIELSGLFEYYKKESERTITSNDRAENLGELVSSAKDFVKDLEDAEENEAEMVEGKKVTKLQIAELFIDKCALGDYDEEKEVGKDDQSQAVKLMTVHSAKGLEFEAVIIVGMEQGAFPHLGFDSKVDIDEERRLCYVAITRAKKELVMTAATNRTIFGSKQLQSVSSFIDELPKEKIARIYRDLPEIQETTVSSYSNPVDNYPDCAIGAIVNHPQFGTGKIIMIDNQGEDTRIKVKFKYSGLRTLLLKYAPLTFN